MQYLYTGGQPHIDRRRQVILEAARKAAKCKPDQRPSRQKKNPRRRSPLHRPDEQEDGDQNEGEGDDHDEAEGVEQDEEQGADQDEDQDIEQDEEEGNDQDEEEGSDQDEEEGSDQDEEEGSDQDERQGIEQEELQRHGQDGTEDVEQCDAEDDEQEQAQGGEQDKEEGGDQNEKEGGDQNEKEGGDEDEGVNDPAEDPPSPATSLSPHSSPSPPQNSEEDQALAAVVRTAPTDQRSRASTATCPFEYPRELLGRMTMKLRLSESTNEPTLGETLKEILLDRAVWIAYEKAREKKSKKPGDKAKPLANSIEELIVLISSLFTPDAYLELKASMDHILRRTGVANLPRDRRNEPARGYSLAGMALDGEPPDTIRALQQRWNHARHLTSLGDSCWHKVDLTLVRLELYNYWKQALRIYTSTSDDDKSVKDRKCMERFVDRALPGRRGKRGGKRADELKRALSPYLGIYGEDNKNMWAYAIRVGSHVAVFNQLWGLLPLIKPSKYVYPALK